MITQLLILKPGIVSRAQKTRLRKSNIEVIETDYPGDVHFKQAEAELSGSELFLAAMRALNNCSYHGDKAKMVENMLAMLESKQANTPTQQEQ